MIYFLIIVYFLCGAGVTAATNDIESKEKLHSRLLMFVASLLFWPAVFTFAVVTMAQVITDKEAS